VYQPNKGDPKVSGSVADGSIAASSVPAHETFLGQAHASELLLALGKCQVCRDRLNHIGATVGVEYLVRSTQKVREGLAVAAVTDCAVHAFGMRNDALENSALTAQWVIHYSL
jgi:hypothetical protein